MMFEGSRRAYNNVAHSLNATLPEREECGAH